MATVENERISFTLDGQAVEAAPGETVLSVARRHGVAIPTLCHHESVSDYGACRLCLVEVRWGNRSKMVTSCLYTPYAGDSVETNNDRVRKVRRLILELLLARTPDAEEIRQLADEYGVGTPRFRKPVLEIERERCILCDLCVRVCDEMVGQHAIGYANRGSERVITVPFGEQAEECIGCAACVFVCPTDALHYEDFDGQRIMTELHTQMPLVACSACGSHFATEKQIAKMQERLNIPLETARMCPRCRENELAVVLDKSLVTRAGR